MNIVFDDQMVLKPEFRSALNILLPEGLAPLTLDPIDGLKGTPNEEEGFVFLSALPADVLGYHGKFFQEYQKAPQWFFVLINHSDHGIMLLNNAAMQYDLKNCKTFFAPDLDSFIETIHKIASAKVRVPGKVLIYSKNKKELGEELGQYLFGSNKNMYDVRESVEGTETDASFLLLCGEQEKDFQMVELPDGMEPFFVVLRPEWHIQQYLEPACLVSALVSEYGMTAERVHNRIFFISVRGEAWLDTKPFVKENAIPDILVWDSFGLPLPREEYTADTISMFLDKNFADGRCLKELLSTY